MNTSSPHQRGSPHRTSPCSRSTIIRVRSPTPTAGPRVTQRAILPNAPSWRAPPSNQSSGTTTTQGIPHAAATHASSRRLLAPTPASDVSERSACSGATRLVTHDVGQPGILSTLECASRVERLRIAQARPRPEKVAVRAAGTPEAGTANRPGPEPTCCHRSRRGPIHTHALHKTSHEKSKSGVRPYGSRTTPHYATLVRTRHAE